MAIEDTITRIADALEGIESEQGAHGSVTIDFDVDSHNLIASLWEELNGINKSLAIIAERMQNAK